MVRKIIYTESVEGCTIKVYRDSEYNEFICREFINGKLQPLNDYFTTDKEDAIGTAKAMLHDYLDRAEFAATELFRGMF